MRYCVPALSRWWSRPSNGWKDPVLHEDVYLATSEGEKLPSLKPLRKNKAKLDRISTKRNKSKRGSKSRRKLANQ